MARTVVVRGEHAPSAVRRPLVQAYDLLHWGYVILPVIAGLDKFANVLARWDRYLADPIARLFPWSKQHVMMGVGVIEVVAAFLVAVRPSIGAYVVAGWLFGIIVNLVIAGGHWDIALRDLGLMLGALALGRLAAARAAEID